MVYLPSLSRRLRLCVILLAATFWIAPASAQHRFSVDTVDDQPDLVPGDGLCQTELKSCSLRAAIEEANATANLTAGPDVIDFKTIPIDGNGQAVILTGPDPLPSITDPLEIDGTDSPGPIVIDGSGQSGARTGLSLSNGSRGSTIRGLFIGHFEVSAITLHSGSNTIAGNSIGVDPQGKAIGNGSEQVAGATGILVYSDANRLEDNTIGFTAGTGIRVSGGADNTMARNAIGTDVSGRRFGNTGAGIHVHPSPPAKHEDAGDLRTGVMTGQTITGNTIGLNGSDGILLETSDNHVRGNTIGTNAAGAILGNDGAGIRVMDGGEFNIIGGLTAEEGNLIGHNTFGLHINGKNNLVGSNHLGVTPDGRPAPNDVADIQIDDEGWSNTIGAPGAGNVIEASTLGIGIFEGLANQIQSNYIGTDAQGRRLGNPSATGIFILQASSTGIGRGEPAVFRATLLPEGNTIAYLGTAVHVQGDDAIRNLIRGNAMYGNAIAGIDLGEDGGRTANDAGDADEGPNNLQNYPVIEDVFYSAETDQVRFIYRVPTDVDHANFPLAIDFYVASDPSVAQGAVYLGTDIYTPSDERASFGIDLADLSIVVADFFVATATDDHGNTSEFSLPVPFSGELPVELVRFDAVADGQDVHLRWQTASETNNAGFHVERRTDASPLWETVTFVAGQGTTDVRQDYTYRVAGLAPGAHHFRLRQVDFDGAFAYSAIVTVLTAIDADYELSSPYPNPFNPQTAFTLTLTRQERVRMAVHDALGRQVALVHDGELAAATHPFRLDATHLAAGIYYLRVESPTFTTTRRLALIR